jgi:hypothetical protein
MNLYFTQQRWMEEGKIYKNIKKKIYIKLTDNSASVF